MGPALGMLLSVGLEGPRLLSEHCDLLSPSLTTCHNGIQLPWLANTWPSALTKLFGSLPSAGITFLREHCLLAECESLAP